MFYSTVKEEKKNNDDPPQKLTMTINLSLHDAQTLSHIHTLDTVVFMQRDKNQY